MSKGALRRGLDQAKLALPKKLSEVEWHSISILAARFAFRMPKPPNSPSKQTIAVAPMAVMPRQMQMFSRKAIIEFPPSERSADYLGEVQADDTHYYYIKGDQPGRLVRASEWICTNISETVGIGAPTPAAIERIDGTVVFGSRRIAGVADKAITVNYLTTPSATNLGVPASGLQSVLSSIYALDMFIQNDDRHFGNYLSVDDNGTRRLYAFDYSRALFWRWPWQGFPKKGTIEEGFRTRPCGTILRNLHGFDRNAASQTLDRLSGLAPATIEGFVNQMPTDWLPAEVRSQFVGWWASEARNARIEELRAGIIDGTLL